MFGLEKKKDFLLQPFIQFTVSSHPLLFFACITLFVSFPDAFFFFIHRSLTQLLRIFLFLLFLPRSFQSRFLHFLHFLPRHSSFTPVFCVFQQKTNALLFFFSFEKRIAKTFSLDCWPVAENVLRVFSCVLWSVLNGYFIYFLVDFPFCFFFFFLFRLHFYFALA